MRTAIVAIVAFVGWGERSEPQHRALDMLGIAALSPTYGLDGGAR
ncbi:MAG: hypothetical protein JWQ90_409 [Hydrocarboniphaga sp.]|nr:hypothetical protein [Hydrocarboniphaga sp.]